MDGGAWWATVHRVTKSWTGLSNFSFFHFEEEERVKRLSWRWEGLVNSRGQQVGWMVDCGTKWERRVGRENWKNSGPAGAGLEYKLRKFDLRRNHYIVLIPGAALSRASQVALVVKNPPGSTGDVRDVGSIPGLGRSPAGGHATHSSILAWRIPWTEEPGGLQSMGSYRVRHDWSDLACTHAALSNGPLGRCASPVLHELH